MTVAEDFHIEVSKRIKEDYGNGREYYRMHGKKLIDMPDREQEMPSIEFMRWHNENVYISQYNSKWTEKDVVILRDKYDV